MYEELYGLSACTENLEYTMHLPEDIRCLSNPDNYWCYVYEHLVKYYKRQTTNQKNIALMNTTRAAQLRLVSNYLVINGGLGMDDDRTTTLARIFDSPVLMKTSTIEDALFLKEYISCSSQVPPEAKEVMTSGTLISSGRLTDRFSMTLDVGLRRLTLM